MKVCAMQPAFIPPASYFRLFAASDVFVILDDVQFDRRWYTHRQKLTNRNGKKEWLTLPIKKMPRDTTMIKDMEWFNSLTEICIKEWQNRLRKFPVFDTDIFLVKNIKSLNGMCPVIKCLHTWLWEFSRKLGVLKGDYLFPYQYSSAVDIDTSLRGQDRIIAICKKLGATEYINSPGGRGLYDEESLAKEGVKLTFLPEWQGSYDSILERLAHEKPEDIRKEIYAQI